MKIKLFGGLRQKAGGAVHAAGGVTIREGVERLCETRAPLRAAIFDGHELRPHVRIMVNGQDCELAQGLETVVSENDQIAIFPPLAGG